MIRIYGICLDSLPDSANELLTALPISIADPWQRQHPSLREKNAKKASLAGVWLLWRAKSDALLAYTADGKPFLQNFEGAISITHTKTHAFCAILDERGEIGLDAESFGRISPDRLQALSDRWFTEAEKEAFHQAQSEERFLEIWTRKEALVKLTGDGMRALHRTDTQDESLDIHYATYRLDSTIVSLAFPKNSIPPTEILFL